MSFIVGKMLSLSSSYYMNMWRFFNQNNKGSIIVIYHTTTATQEIINRNDYLICDSNAHFYTY